MSGVRKFFNILFSIEFAVVLSLIFIPAMMYATLGFASMNDAWKYVYETKWFEAILWLLGINLVGVMFRYKTYKKPPIFLLHLSICLLYTSPSPRD